TDKNDRAMPAVLQFSKRARGADERGPVCVVAARVHYRNIAAFVVFGGDSSRVWNSRLFMHGQRVHVRANQNGRTAAIFHYANNAVTFQVWLVVRTKILRYFTADRAQFLRYEGRGAFLVAGQFRMVVDVFVNREQRRQLGIGK